MIYRHNTAEQFLRLIGAADPLQEAELIEHYFGGRTIDRLHALLAFF